MQKMTTVVSFGVVSGKAAHKPSEQGAARQLHGTGKGQDGRPPPEVPQPLSCLQGINIAYIIPTHIL